MNLRCKQGDFALIIRGNNSGKFVTVEKAVGQAKPGDLCTLDHNGVWYAVRIVGRSGFFWLCISKMQLHDAEGRASSFGVIPDHWLLPIRPERDPDSVPRVLEKPHESIS